MSPIPAGGFTCAEVVGFSQTRDWYHEGATEETPSAFEQVVDNDRWQVLAVAMAAVDRWATPDYPGWQHNRRKSHCAKRPENPDLVVLTISGAHGEGVEIWVRHIRGAIGTICERYDAIRTIALQPVIGNHGAVCTKFGGEVRASWQHSYISEAITEVVSSYELSGVCADGRTLSVVHGFDPHVRTCDDFADGLGHLTDEGSLAVAEAAGAFYATW